MADDGDKGRSASGLIALLLLAVSAFVVMPVFTFGGPYAEDAENRRRVRYAALSGLALTGYTVNDNRRIGFVRVATTPLRVVPYEWLTGADGARVLLLWIDEEAKWET